MLWFFLYSNLYMFVCFIQPSGCHFISSFRNGMSLCDHAASVVRPSVCPSVRPSVCKLFAQIASSTRQMAGSTPNLHTMVPRRACIQCVLNVTVEVNGSKVMWYGHFPFVAKITSHAQTAGSRSNLHTTVHSPACITFIHSASKLRVRQLDLMSTSRNELLCHWWSGVPFSYECL